MAGAATPDRSEWRRISQLERDLAKLRLRLDRQSRAEISHAWPKDVWLAKTVSSALDSPTYPDDPANTYRIELLDSYFPAVPGWQVVEDQVRGEKLVANYRSGTYLAEGTVVVAFNSRGLGPVGSGEWWIVHVPQQTTTATMLWYRTQ
jgi:hypothetical protein